jgi:hypothetical protein
MGACYHTACFLCNNNSRIYIANSQSLTNSNFSHDRLRKKERNTNINLNLPLLRECAIFPPTTPWSEFPAKREKEPAFALIVSSVRSEPHTPKDSPDVVSEYAKTPRKEGL